MQTSRSSISEIVWPAIPSPAGAMMMALQYQLEQSQWWPAETIEQLQMRQLETLLRHAYGRLPHYRAVLNDIGLNPAQPLNAQRFARLPQLPAADWAGIAGIRQIQLHQRDVGEIVVRVESPQPLTDAEQRQLADALRPRVGSHTKFTISHHDEIPRHANGKFERFVCHVADAGG